ncbi:hypothetical protein M758_3G205900 [Ceratodon purpureus]|uniref:S5 DRBM domain-containing protein n=1 Tax=Ceratodon purpureus TaxID=3225 RepID=A0A8T0IN34_CERPU|nr:hypothetical protein KC19_3G206300 [Ceratodon purpureus]KAG0623838.1 hypothetical protein M758_3G205900 [Ceratodon purpureus]
MWGARGARLWRTLHRIRDGAAAAASRDPSSSSLLLLRSLASSASSEAGALARDARSRLPAGLLQGALRGVPAVAQQRMGISTRSECCRATSDSGSYTPGPQKEPLLRPKEIDVEDDVDEEPLEEDVGEIVADVKPRELSSLELELQNAPRRKQRFILQKALKIRNTETEGRPRKQGFTMKVVDVNRTCKVTKGGGILNFTALVICGNGDGVAGYGKGKSAEVSAAVDKAYARALRNLHYFERFDGHTIFHEKHSKYGQTKIYLWPALSGTGMRASHTVGGILRLAGFKNVKSKVVGSRHPHNTVKAVFQALSEIETPEEAAEREGRERVTHHA